MYWLGADLLLGVTENTRSDEADGVAAEHANIFRAKVLMNRKTVTFFSITKYCNHLIRLRLIKWPWHNESGRNLKFKLKSSNIVN